MKLEIKLDRLELFFFFNMATFVTYKEKWSSNEDGLRG